MRPVPPCLRCGGQRAGKIAHFDGGARVDQLPIGNQCPTVRYIPRHRIMRHCQQFQRETALEAHLVQRTAELQPVQGQRQPLPKRQPFVAAIPAQPLSGRRRVVVLHPRRPAIFVA